MNSVTIRQWSKKAQEFLRANEIEVDIQHTRFTPLFAVTEVSEKGVKSFDRFLSKKEFIEAMKNGNYFSGDEKITINDYHKVISATDGFTRVTLNFKDGVQIVGKYNYGATGHFFKALGIANAIKKAVGKAGMGDLYSKLMELTKKENQNAETAQSA